MIFGGQPNLTIMSYIHKFGSAKDVEDCITLARQEPQNVQVAFHPQLVPNLIGVLGLVIHGFEASDCN